MAPRALVILADGFEEIEAVTVVDVLRRANVDVYVASLSGSEVVTGNKGIRVVADGPLAGVDEKEYDVVVLPGGMPGTERLMASEAVLGILRARRRRAESGAGRALVGAICAAPLVLDAAGVLPETYTCYPGVEGRMRTRGARRSQVAVVQSGNTITSQGPGTAMAFALAIVGALCGPSVASKLSSGLIAPRI